MPLSNTFACNPAIRFSSFLHLLPVPSLASCIYPSTMAVRTGASIDLSPSPGTTHSHSVVAWLFNSAFGNGTVIGSMRPGYLQVPLGKRFSCPTHAHMQPIAVQFWHRYSLLLLARWSDNKSGSAGDGDTCSGPRVKKTAKSVSASALCNRAVVWRLAFVPHLLRYLCIFYLLYIYMYIYIYFFLYKYYTLGPSLSSLFEAMVRRGTPSWNYFLGDWNYFNI